MPLCDYCSGIPEHPPPLPPMFHKRLIHKPNSHISYVDHPCDFGFNSRSFGYPHHQSIHDLQFSSRTCRLCDGILHEFQSVVPHAMHPIADHGFYVTQRDNLLDGFYVWVFDVMDNILFVGAFGFLVKDSMLLSLRSSGVSRKSNALGQMTIPSQMSSQGVKFGGWPMRITPRISLGIGSWSASIIIHYAVHRKVQSLRCPRGSSMWDDLRQVKSNF